MTLETYEKLIAEELENNGYIPINRIEKLLKMLIVLVKTEQITIKEYLTMVNDLKAITE